MRERRVFPAKNTLRPDGAISWLNGFIDALWSAVYVRSGSGDLSRCAVLTIGAETHETSATRYRHTRTKEVLPHSTVSDDTVLYPSDDTFVRTHTARAF